MIGGVATDLSARTIVMAIVNRTPDSFFDEGATFALEAAIAAGVRAVDDGADWVDVGGVPFAPGEPLPPKVELERVLPVVRALHEERPSAVLSVDTFHASVAEACLAAGAGIVNDTTGLTDPRLAAVVAAHGAQVVLTHSLAAPRRPYPAPRYDDVVKQVHARLRELVAGALAAGVGEHQLIIDPGPDLNKNTVHTLALLRDFAVFRTDGHPVLAAFSRKDVIGEALGLPKEERLAGSLAAASAAIVAGANVLRVHDVAATRQAADFLDCVAGRREPIEARHNVAPGSGQRWEGRGRDE